MITMEIRALKQVKTIMSHVQVMINDVNVEIVY